MTLKHPSVQAPLGKLDSLKLGAVGKKRCCCALCWRELHTLNFSPKWPHEDLIIICVQLVALVVVVGRCLVVVVSVCVPIEAAAATANKHTVQPTNTHTHPPTPEQEREGDRQRRAVVRELSLARAVGTRTHKRLGGKGLGRPSASECLPGNLVSSHCASYHTQRCQPTKQTHPTTKRQQEPEQPKNNLSCFACSLWCSLLLFKFCCGMLLSTDRCHTPRSNYRRGVTAASDERHLFQAGASARRVRL